MLSNLAAMDNLVAIKVKVLKCGDQDGNGRYMVVVHHTKACLLRNCQAGWLTIKSTQTARQADGQSPLCVTGETWFILHRDNYEFVFEGLVVKSLDVDILAGVPFMTAIDAGIRPAKHQIILHDGGIYQYWQVQTDSSYTHCVRRTHFALFLSVQKICPSVRYLIGSPAYRHLLTASELIQTASYPRMWETDFIWYIVSAEFETEFEYLTVKSTLYTLNTYPWGPNFGLFCSTISRFRDTCTRSAKIGNALNDPKLKLKTWQS